MTIFWWWCRRGGFFFFWQLRLLHLWTWFEPDFSILFYVFNLSAITATSSHRRPSVIKQSTFGINECHVFRLSIIEFKNRFSSSNSDYQVKNRFSKVKPDFQKWKPIFKSEIRFSKVKTDSQKWKPILKFEFRIVFCMLRIGF